MKSIIASLLLVFSSTGANASYGYENYVFNCEDHFSKTRSVYSYPVTFNHTPLTFENTSTGRENLRLSVGVELPSNIESNRLVGDGKFPVGDTSGELPVGLEYVSQHANGVITQLIKLTEVIRKDEACAGVLRSNARKCRISEYAVVLNMTWGHVVEIWGVNPKRTPVESPVSLICVEKENL